MKTNANLLIKITDLLIRIIIYASIVYIFTNGGARVTVLDVITLFGFFIVVVGAKLLGFLKRWEQENYLRAKVMSNTWTLIFIIIISYMNANFFEKNISVVVVSLVLLAVISTFDIIRYKNIKRIQN